MKQLYGTAVLVQARDSMRVVVMMLALVACTEKSNDVSEQEMPEESAEALVQTGCKDGDKDECKYQADSGGSPGDPLAAVTDVTFRFATSIFRQGVDFTSAGTPFTATLQPRGLENESLDFIAKTVGGVTTFNVAKGDFYDVLDTLTAKGEQGQYRYKHSDVVLTFTKSSTQATTQTLSLAGPLLYTFLISITDARSKRVLREFFGPGMSLNYILLAVEFDKVDKD